MTMQSDLFADYGNRLRDAGMARAVERDPSWSDLAYAEIVSLAQRQAELHTDDLIAFCARHPAPSRYAMGPVWMRAIKAGVIADSGWTRRTRDPKKHSHRMAVYHSLLCR